MRHILFSPESQGGSEWGSDRSDEISVILDNKQNAADQYDQQISNLKKSIAEVQKTIIHYTKARSEYQSLYQQKKQTIEDLQAEYKRIIWDHMSDQEKQDFEDQKKREKEIWQAIFSSMGFDQDNIRGEFNTEEEFFKHRQQEQKNKSDANYVKKSMEEVTGELVDHIKDLPLKTIYRKITLLLHPDPLGHNQQVAPHEDYLKYLSDLHLKIISARENKDKATMIMLIQDAGIIYRNEKFFVASYEDCKDIVIYANKKILIQDLGYRLQALKTNYIYIFYLKHTQRETHKELRDLDDKIQELEDLIASYQQTDE